MWANPPRLPAASRAERYQFDGTNGSVCWTRVALRSPEIVLESPGTSLAPVAPGAAGLAAEGADGPGVAVFAHAARQIATTGKATALTIRRFI
jgi:hypothetical protein